MHRWFTCYGERDAQSLEQRERLVQDEPAAQHNQAALDVTDDIVTERQQSHNIHERSST